MTATKGAAKAAERAARGKPVAKSGEIKAAAQSDAKNVGLPWVKDPETVGFSAERLQRITAIFQAEIDKGSIPGAVILIARAGKAVYFEALGYRDREAKAPMAPDNVFRIASMTKPVVSAAAMILAEEGKLQLAYPVSRYLPKLTDLKVGVERIGAGGKLMLGLEAPAREMTVQDLMRHTSGLTYGAFGDSLVHRAYRDQNCLDFSQTNADLVAKLAQLPLRYQPGSTWEYGMSTDVLGAVIEAISGQELDAFLDARILKPLGMVDSGFFHRDSRRVAVPQVDPATGKRPPFGAADATKRPSWISGGGGMLSTAADYLRFAEMMRAGGVFQGVHLLSPASVQLMCSDHLPPHVQYGSGVRAMFGAVAPTRDLGYGFGLGFAVRTHPGRNPLPGSVGDHFWSGVTGTYFWIDPVEELVAIKMMQAPAERLHYRYLLRHAVYQAIVGPPRR